MEGTWALLEPQAPKYHEFMHQDEWKFILRVHRQVNIFFVGSYQVSGQLFRRQDINQYKSNYYYQIGILRLINSDQGAQRVRHVQRIAGNKRFWPSNSSRRRRCWPRTIKVRNALTITQVPSDCLQRWERIFRKGEGHIGRLCGMDGHLPKRWGRYPCFSFSIDYYTTFRSFCITSGL